MARDVDSGFLGHPIGLGWLCTAEFWERFSYYGMQSLLVLYMVHSLLLPGHVEHVQGFAAFRRGIEWVYGPLSAQALASAVFGLYAGLVYLTPLAGGLLADRVMGRTWTVVLGASLMIVGHVLMAFDASFLLALLFLVLGVGCYKGNIASQVGDLYVAADPRRGNAFQIFLLMAQLAGILTPLVCGTLGEVFGWHWGFACAAVGMGVGLAAYLLGRQTLPRPPVQTREAAASPRRQLNGSEWRRVALLVALLHVLAIGMVGNSQSFNVYVVWAERTYDLALFGHAIPVTWLFSFAGVSGAVTIIASVMFWRWWRSRRREPDELTLIILGTGLSTLAPVALALAAFIHARTGLRVSLVWAGVFQIVNDIGFANVAPIGQALYSRAAPKGLSALMISVYYIHLFLANMLVGRLGGLLDLMSGVTFWLLHAGLMVLSAAILLVVRATVGKTLSPAYGLPD